MNRKTIGGLTLAALALVGVSTLTVAGANAAPAPVGVAVSEQRSQAAPVPAPGTYSGKVTSNTNNGLTIHGANGDQTVVVQPGATITRDGKGATVSDLKTDDQINLVVGSNGVVQRIDATSKKSSGFNPLWLLLLLLLLIPLLLWLLSRRKKSDDFALERGAGTPRVQGPTTPKTGDDFTIEKNQGNRPRS